MHHKFFKLCSTHFSRWGEKICWGINTPGYGPGLMPTIIPVRTESWWIRLSFPWLTAIKRAHRQQCNGQCTSRVAMVFVRQPAERCSDFRILLAALGRVNFILTSTFSSPRAAWPCTAQSRTGCPRVGAPCATPSQVVERCLRQILHVVDRRPSSPARSTAGLQWCTAFVFQLVTISFLPSHYSG